MIIDVLPNADFYVGLNPHLKTAFDFLRRTDLALLEEGRHAVAGEAVYAVVAQGTGRKPEDALLETHDDYIDIQYVLAGTDTIGWKARTELGESAVKSDPRQDVQFYAETPSAWTAIGPGQFGIYFPDDGHMPMISDGRLHKVIMKVAVS